MKKILVVFAIFAVLIFFVSCGSSSTNDDNTDTGETVTDGDTVDADPESDSDPSGGDTEPTENPDSDNPDTTPDGGDSQSDDSDMLSDDDADSGDTAPDSDDGDTTNENPGNLPDCSSTSGTPCLDSSSGLTWSAMASSTYTWQDAVNYCNSYTEGGLSGWHLPTISELRTLIQNCSGTQMPDGSCGVRDDSVVCLSSSCWTESACSCSSDSTDSIEGHGKFGDTGWFWSSSTLLDATDYAWAVGFGYGYVYYGSKYYDCDVRCVRNAE